MRVRLRRALVVPAAAVQTMLNFATHPGAKTAKPENFIDNSVLDEIGNGERRDGDGADAFFRCAAGMELP